MSFLDVQPPVEEFNGARLSMSWLSQQFHRAPTNQNDDIYVQQYACAYILQVTRGILFLDH